MAVYTGSYAYIQWSPEATFNTAATNLRNHGGSEPDQSNLVLNKELPVGHLLKIKFHYHN